MSGDSGVVNVVNKRGSALFVSSSGSISWDERCITHSGTAVILAVGASCSATVESTNTDPILRLAQWAFRLQQGAARSPNLIETTFQTAMQCAWLNKSGTCVWYDISLIPTSCTDAA